MTFLEIPKTKKLTPNNPKFKISKYLKSDVRRSQVEKFKKWTVVKIEKY